MQATIGSPSLLRKLLIEIDGGLICPRLLFDETHQIAQRITFAPPDHDEWDFPILGQRP
jgi:hypothetical protein